MSGGVPASEAARASDSRGSSLPRRRRPDSDSAPRSALALSEPRTVRVGWFAGAVLVAACMQASAADDDGQGEPGVTPYRPTVSNPADLSAPGWLEAELGGLRTLNEDHSRHDSVPWLLKYALDENYGLLIGGNGYVNAQIPGAPSQSSFGDTSLEWKQRFALNDKTAIGFEAGVLIPTASQDLGVGKAQWLVNGILSTDLGSVHLDVNVGEAHGGAQPMGVSLWQTTWAAAISRPIVGDLGAALELSGVYQQGTATQSQALFALSYNWSRKLVLDCGAAYGLTNGAHDRSFFAGATFLIGRLH